MGNPTGTGTEVHSARDTGVPELRDLVHGVASGGIPSDPHQDAPFDLAWERAYRAMGPGGLPILAACRAAWKAGTIDGADLRAAALSLPAADQAPMGAMLAVLEGAEEGRAVASPFPTIAAVAGERMGAEYFRCVEQQLQSWAGPYFAARRETFLMPFGDPGALAVWREDLRAGARDTLGVLNSTAATLATMPADATDLCVWALGRLPVPPAHHGTYLQRLLLEVRGMVLPEEPGSPPHRTQTATLNLELLAIRLAWESLLFHALADRGIELSWRRALRAVPSAGAAPGAACALRVLQARERALERYVTALLHADEGPTASGPQKGLSLAPGELSLAAPAHLLKRVAGEAITPHAYDAGRDRDFSLLAELLRRHARTARTTALRPGVRPALYLAAPIGAINAVLAAHSEIRILADQDWIRLFAIYDGGAIVTRYAGHLHWAPGTGQDVA